MIIPEWFCTAVGADIADTSFRCGGKTYAYDNGVWSATNLLVSNNQKQTMEKKKKHSILLQRYNGCVAGYVNATVNLRSFYRYCQNCLLF